MHSIAQQKCNRLFLFPSVIVPTLSKYFTKNSLLSVGVIYRADSQTEAKTSPHSRLLDRGNNVWALPALFSYETQLLMPEIVLCLRFSLAEITWRLIAPVSASVRRCSSASSSFYWWLVLNPVIIVSIL